jgi:hypothetical protein
MLRFVKSIREYWSCTFDRYIILCDNIKGDMAVIAQCWLTFLQCKHIMMLYVPFWFVFSALDLYINLRVVFSRLVIVLLAKSCPGLYWRILSFSPLEIVVSFDELG